MFSLRSQSPATFRFRGCVSSEGTRPTPERSPRRSGIVASDGGPALRLTVAYFRHTPNSKNLLTLRTQGSQGRALHSQNGVRLNDVWLIAAGRRQIFFYMGLEAAAAGLGRGGAGEERPAGRRQIFFYMGLEPAAAALARVASANKAPAGSEDGCAWGSDLAAASMTFGSDLSSSGLVVGSGAGTFRHNSAASSMLWASCCLIASQLLKVAFSRSIASRLRALRAWWCAFTRSSSAWIRTFSSALRVHSASTCLRWTAS